MIEFILEILAEFGLQHSNREHQKKVAEKEKEDGIKRPFEKMFWKPSFRIGLIIIALTFIVLYIFSSYQNNVTLPNKTKQEIFEISNYINDWFAKFDSLPQDISEIIKGRPLRQEWLNDA